MTCKEMKNSLLRMILQMQDDLNVEKKKMEKMKIIHIF